jgi:hypothetical protein
MLIWRFFWGGGRNSPQWASPFSMFLDHTQRHTTVARSPLHEGSARRRDLYLTTHRHPCPGWDVGSFAQPYYFSVYIYCLYRISIIQNYLHGFCTYKKCWGEANFWYHRDLLCTVFFVSYTKRLGSIIQGMQLFGKIILSCSFSQLFGF